MFSLNKFRILSALLLLIYRAIPSSSQNLEKLGIGKMVNCSDVDSSSSAFNAIDGNPMTSYKISSTGTQWLSIDLFWLYRIKNITTLLPSTLSTSLTMTAGVTNAEPGNPPSFYSCQASALSIGSNVIFDCPNGDQSVGKYVALTQLVAAFLLPWEVLEVEIYGIWAERVPPRSNVLLRKPSLMKSALSTYTAQKAVDGIKDTDFLKGFCAQSGEMILANNWIQIDMLDDYYIDYVAITSPKNPTDSSRMDSFRVGFLDSTTNIPPITSQIPLCDIFPGPVPPGRRVTLQCNANLPPFQVLIIQQTSTSNTGLFPACELEAYPAVDENRMVWTKVSNGHYLDRHQITGFENMSARSIINCAIKCSKFGPKSCDSFNFNPVLKLCQLNAHRNGYPKSDLVKSNVLSVWMAVYADTINF